MLGEFWTQVSQCGCSQWSSIQFMRCEQTLGVSNGEEDVRVGDKYLIHSQAAALSAAARPAPRRTQGPMGTSRPAAVAGGGDLGETGTGASLQLALLPPRQRLNNWRAGARARRTSNVQFTPPARHDKTVLSVSCLMRRCELDDCSERVQT